MRGKMPRVLERLRKRTGRKKKGCKRREQTIPDIFVGDRKKIVRRCWYCLIVGEKGIVSIFFYFIFENCHNDRNTQMLSNDNGGDTGEDLVDLYKLFGR